METIQITYFEQVPAALNFLIKEVADLKAFIATLGAGAASNNSEIGEYITRKQAKEILKVSYPTLHAWTNDGRLKGYKLGTRVRYKKAEIDEAHKAMRSSKKAA